MVSYTASLRALTHDARDDPPLALAQRPALDDGDAIADLRGVVFVVRHELRRPALGLAVEAVPHLPLDRNDAGLLHLVADDDAFFFRFLSHWLVATPASAFSRDHRLDARQVAAREAQLERRIELAERLLNAASGRADPRAPSRAPPDRPPTGRAVPPRPS